VYFDDLDAYGMLYNGRYVALIDRGFSACLARMGLDLGHEDVTVVVREIALTFAEPIRRVGEVDLVFWVTRIGRSSATFEFLVQSDGTEHVRGHRSVTKFDPVAGCSKPWSVRALALFQVDSQDLQPSGGGSADPTGGSD
jgi:YbgC/YbaW family acyl-CoA thioester hydrolase